MVVNGAGAAALACTALIKALGIRHENVIVCDRSGPIYPGRDDVDQWKSAHAVATEARTLEDALVGADIFLGLSAAVPLHPERSEERRAGTECVGMCGSMCGPENYKKQHKKK